jgi:hypothetical protein
VDGSGESAVPGGRGEHLGRFGCRGDLWRGLASEDREEVVVVNDDHSRGLLVSQVRVVGDDSGHGGGVGPVPQEGADRSTNLRGNHRLEGCSTAGRELAGFARQTTRPLNGRQKFGIEPEWSSVIAAIAVAVGARAGIRQMPVPRRMVDVRLPTQASGVRASEPYASADQMES